MRSRASSPFARLRARVEETIDRRGIKPSLGRDAMRQSRSRRTRRDGGAVEPIGDRVERRARIDLLQSAAVDRGKFIWPTPRDGVVAISAAQLGYMLDGIDWRNPRWTWRPELAE